MPYEFKEEDIEELRVICEREYGRSFKTEEAYSIAFSLMQLYRCMRCLPEEHWETKT